MTIAATTNRADYIGTNSFGPFPFAFRVLAATDLLIVTRDGTGTETVLTYGVDYTVAPAGTGSDPYASGGTITLSLAPLAIGSTMAVTRGNLGLTQPTSIKNQGAFHPEIHEQQFDRITLQLQKLQEQADRAIGVSVTHAPSGLGLQSLNPVPGSSIGWDDSGNLTSLPFSTTIAGSDVDLTTATLGWIFTGGISKTIGLARLAGYLARAVLGVYVVTDPKFGAIGNGVNDDAPGIQAAYAAGVSAVGSGFTVFFPRASGGYKTLSTVQVSVRGVTFLFHGGADQNGINFAGAGPAIQLGTDDGLSWDASNYNGPAQGFAYVGGSLVYSGAGSALANGLGNYGVGTYGIRDWRGGFLKIEDVSLQGFEYGVWGVQSDINQFRRITAQKNKTVFFLGARSDQARFDHIWTSHNDTVFTFEGSKNHLVTHWTTDSDGSASTYPYDIHNSTPAVNAKYATTRVTSGHEFDVCWFETLAGGNQTIVVPAFGKVNVGDATRAGPLTLRNCVVFANLYSTGGIQRTQYLVEADNLTSLVIDGIAGAPGQIPWTNLQALIKVDSGAGAAPYIWLRDNDLNTGSGTRLIENYSASTVTISGVHDGALTNYGANIVGGTGPVSQAWLGLQRSIYHNNAPPTAGNGGDVQFNRTFVAGKSIGWAWTGGSAVVLHAPTVASDRGDVAVTLTPETDYELQNFTTNLTADRDCVLAAPPAVAHGYRFHIKRGGGGAFNLNVKNLTAGGTVLKAMPASSWAEFFCDGTNWSLRSYGTL